MRTKRNMAAKQKLAVVLLTAMAFTTGCGAGADGNEMGDGEEVIAVSGENGGSGDAGEGEKVLTLGSVYQGSEFSNLAEIVKQYNATNPEYVVRLVDYGPESGELTEEDYDTAANRFLMELAKGEGTDLIDLSEALDGSGKEILGTTGILADLYELRSKEAWQENYLENILECAQTGNKLYGIGGSFDIFTILGNGDCLGSGTGWSLQQMMDAFEQNGKGPEALGGFFLDQSRIETLAGFCLDDFIDWTEGTANFDTEDFYRLLEVAWELEQVPLQHGSKGELEEVRSGEQLASFEFVTSVTSYQVQKIIYGESMAVKGAPASSGTGVAVRFSNQLGINAGSDKKEAALAFLDYCLKNPLETASFSLEKEGLERDFANAMEESLDGEGHIQPKTYLEADGEYLPVYAAGEEDVAEVRRLIDLADREYCYNTVVMSIIREETEGYLAGAKTVEEASRNINNRVQIYLDEQ